MSECSRQWYGSIIYKSSKQIIESHNKVINQEQCYKHIESWIDLIDIDSAYINIDNDASYNISCRNIIREEFYGTIDRFCDNLTLFTKYAKDPIEQQICIIKKKIIHTSEFNLYVDEVNYFNNTIRHIGSLLSDIITALNTLFVRKKKRYFAKFIEHIYHFVLYLLINDVFTHVKHLRTKLDKKIRNNIIKIKILIFDIFNISLDILSLFIPQFTVVKKSCNILENHINRRFSIIQDILNENEHNICIDNIIRQILNIRPQSELLISFKKTINFNNLIKLENDKLIMLIKTLQNDYIRLINTVDTLGGEISNYRNEQRNIFTRIMESMNSYVNV
jgi:hypothetical protein